MDSYSVSIETLSALSNFTLPDVKYRLCIECIEIFEMATDIFKLCEHKKLSMFDHACGDLDAQSIVKKLGYSDRDVTFSSSNSNNQTSSSAITQCSMTNTTDTTTTTSIKSTTSVSTSVSRVDIGTSPMKFESEIMTTTTSQIMNSSSIIKATSHMNTANRSPLQDIINKTPTKINKHIDNNNNLNSSNHRKLDGNIKNEKTFQLKQPIANDNFLDIDKENKVVAMNCLPSPLRPVNTPVRLPQEKAQVSNTKKSAIYGNSKPPIYGSKTPLLHDNCTENDNDDNFTNIDSILSSFDTPTKHNIGNISNSTHIKTISTNIIQSIAEDNYHSDSIITTNKDKEQELYLRKDRYKNKYIYKKASQKLYCSQFALKHIQQNILSSVTIDLMLKIIIIVLITLSLLFYSATTNITNINTTNNTNITTMTNTNTTSSNQLFWIPDEITSQENYLSDYIITSNNNNNNNNYNHLHPILTSTSSTVAPVVVVVEQCTLQDVFIDIFNNQPKDICTDNNNNNNFNNSNVPITSHLINSHTYSIHSVDSFTTRTTSISHYNYILQLFLYFHRIILANNDY